METQKRVSLSYFFASLYILTFWLNPLGLFFSPVQKLYVSIGMYIFLALVGVYVYRSELKEGLIWIANNWWRAIQITIGAGIASYLLALLFSLLVTLLTSLLGVSEELMNDIGISHALTVASPVLIIVVLGIIGPLVEELFYRQFLLATVGQKLPVHYRILFSSLSFALVHTQQFSLSEWIGVLPHFAVGLVYALLFQKTKGNAWFGIFLHILNNSSIFLLYYLQG